MGRTISNGQYKKKRLLNGKIVNIVNKSVYFFMNGLTFGFTVALFLEEGLCHPVSSQLKGPEIKTASERK